MEVDITAFEVKTEDNPVPDALLDKASVSSGGPGTPPSPAAKPLSRQTSPNPSLPDYGGDGRRTPERDQHDELEEQAEAELRSVSVDL